MDGLGVFRVGQASVCLGPHLDEGWGWRAEASLGPPVEDLCWMFQGGASFVGRLCCLCLVFVSFRVCSLLPSGHLKGKG